MMFFNIINKIHNHACKNAMDLTSSIVDMLRLLELHNVIEKNYDAFNERIFWLHMITMISLRLQKCFVFECGMCIISSTFCFYCLLFLFCNGWYI
jgi:hypothetical protein